MARKKKPQIRNAEIMKRKFKYESKGKITKRELEEIKRTHSNVFNWLGKEKAKLEEKRIFEEK